MAIAFGNIRQKSVKIQVDWWKKEQVNNLFTSSLIPKAGDCEVWWHQLASQMEG